MYKLFHCPSLRQKVTWLQTSNWNSSHALDFEVPVKFSVSYLNYYILHGSDHVVCTPRMPQLAFYQCLSPRFLHLYRSEFSKDERRKSNHWSWTIWAWSKFLFWVLLSHVWCEYWSTECLSNLVEPNQFATSLEQKHFRRSRLESFLVRC